MIISKDNKIPALYAQEEVSDPLVYVSIQIGAAFWLLTELDREKELAFGYAELFDGGGELGYIYLPEIEDIVKEKSGVQGVVLEYKEPVPLSKMKKEFKVKTEEITKTMNLERILWI